MSYSICGLIIHQREEHVCAGRHWPVITLQCGLSLIPIEREYQFLIAGDETEPADDFQFNPSRWLSDMGSWFSRSAYIEAEFWGGSGMQASVVFERSTIVAGPVISSGAINFALRHMGIDDESSITSSGLSVRTGRDPFDMAGLGRHNSVGGWMQERAELGAAPKCGPITQKDNSNIQDGPQ